MKTMKEFGEKWGGGTKCGALCGQGRAYIHKGGRRPCARRLGCFGGGGRVLTHRPLHGADGVSLTASAEPS